MVSYNKCQVETPDSTGKIKSLVLNNQAKK
jgi:hypothetical protein